MIESSELIPAAVAGELESSDVERWSSLSAKAQRAATRSDFGDAHQELRHAVESDTVSSMAAVYPMWLGDSLMRAGKVDDAVASYEIALERSTEKRRFAGIDVHTTSLHHLAMARGNAGDVEGAIEILRELNADGRHLPAIYEAGELAEGHRRWDLAGSLYEEIAAETRGPATDDVRQLALRAKERLEDGDAVFRPSPLALAASLQNSLAQGDLALIETMASATHLMAGPGGGHFRFDDGVIQLLRTDLVRSRPRTRGIVGSGKKRYLLTEGWKGEHLRGVVGFCFAESARGWQWTGLVVTTATDLWREKWTPRTIRKNQPLPFELKAPWPEGQSFKAGGLIDFGLKSAAVLAAGIFGPAVAYGFSRSQCGFGTRGFYYNQGPTHDDEDAFAIDFTRYRRGVPFDNESGGTPVLVPRAGLVASACGNRSSGDSGGSNTVEIFHDDPDTGQANRYMSRYMHLAGPGLVNLSPGMRAYLGERIGLMNDTGNSALDHLHFSIHDQTVPFPGEGTPGTTVTSDSCAGTVTRGRSVRPTPMEGGTLNDDDDGRCIRSSNEETNVIRLPEGCGRLIVDIIRRAFTRDR